jgi:hypothetical protein
VDARALVAQAALETGWGKRHIKHADGSTSHNLFGIKANGWNGQRAVAGTPNTSMACAATRPPASVPTVRRPRALPTTCAC